MFAPNRRRLLIWDTFRANMTSEFKCVAQNLRLDMPFIPSDCTSVVQPGDVLLNEPFKSFIEQKKVDYAKSARKLPSGRFKPPDVPRVIVAAWKQIEKDVIIRNLRVRGITLKTDGSEDDEIDPFKEGKQLFQPRATLQGIEKTGASVKSRESENSTEMGSTNSEF